MVHYLVRRLLGLLPTLSSLQRIPGMPDGPQGADAKAARPTRAATQGLIPGLISASSSTPSA